MATPHCASCCAAGSNCTGRSRPRRWRHRCYHLLVLDDLLLLSLDLGIPHTPFLYLVRSLRMTVLTRPYRIDRVYPRLAKGAFLSSSSMNASIVQTFFSRTILMVLPVALDVMRMV